MGGHRRSPLPLQLPEGVKNPWGRGDGVPSAGLCFKGGGLHRAAPAHAAPSQRLGGALSPLRSVWGAPLGAAEPCPILRGPALAVPNPILSTQPGVRLSVRPSVRPGVSVCLCTPRGSAPPQHPPLCPCVRLCVRVSEHIPHQGPRSGCPSGSGGRGVIGVRWQLRAARVGTTAVRGDGAGAAGWGRGGLRSGVLPRKTSSCGGRRR